MEKADIYSNALSWIGCAALIVRRRFPFSVALVTAPGFLAGWSELACLFAVASLARRKLWTWQTWIAAFGVWLGRFVRWPPHLFFAATWQAHVLDAIYGVVYAGAPIGLALLAAAKHELSGRIADLAASREREKQLHAAAMLAEERARLAREMHDVVSHQVTLIAMQSGALQVTSRDEESKEVAATIRQLSTRTLEELRQLVGVFRSSSATTPSHPQLDEISELVKDSPVDVTLSAAVPPQGRTIPAGVSAAAYRTVQEALTNVYKHAGNVPTTVSLTVVDDALVVEVRNARPMGRHPASLPSGGHGLTGLRERATLLGGSFHAGRCADGGYLIRASFRLSPVSADLGRPS